MKTPKKKQEVCNHKNQNRIWDLGGEIVKVTNKGLEITKIKGKGIKCANCFKLLSKEV
jgi:hypothetical protein